MALRFEWDSRKAEENIRKHGISFAEATSCFGDSLSISIADPLHSQSEERYLLMGLSMQGRLLVVSHTDRRDIIRVISARLATKRERSQYEES